MIVVSVNFMLSNTVFVHTHYTPDGRAVSHSHPYLPSGDGSHSHSQHSLDQIQSFNLASASFNTSAPMVLDYVCGKGMAIEPQAVQHACIAIITGYPLRAPPCA